MLGPGSDMPKDGSEISYSLQLNQFKHQRRPETQGLKTSPERIAGMTRHKQAQDNYKRVLRMNLMQLNNSKQMRSKSTHKAANYAMDLGHKPMWSERDKKSIKIASFLNIKHDPSTKEPSSVTHSKTQDGDQNRDLEDREPKMGMKSVGNMTGFASGYPQNVAQNGSSRKIRTQNIQKRKKISEFI